MVEKMIVKVVGNYSENDWQNNTEKRTRGLCSRGIR